MTAWWYTVPNERETYLSPAFDLNRLVYVCHVRNTRRRENNNKRVVGPPNGSAVRATASSFSARGADRHGSGNESANDAMVSGGGGDVREQFLQDYDDEETGGRVFKGSKRRKGGAQEVEHHDEGIGNGDIDDDVEEEEEVAAPPSAPKNPFARGKTFSSPPRKKKKVLGARSVAPSTSCPGPHTLCRFCFLSITAVGF